MSELPHHTNPSSRAQPPDRGERNNTHLRLSHSTHNTYTLLSNKKEDKRSERSKNKATAFLPSTHKTLPPYKKQLTSP